MSKLKFDNKIVVINNEDNVATATQAINKEEIISAQLNGKVSEIKIKEYIPIGHKIALVDIPKGEKVIKYGEIIGKASQNIVVGNMVHIHNVESLRGRGDLKVKEELINE